MRHPRSYAIWLFKAVRQAMKKLAWDFLDNPVYLLASLLAAGLLPFAVWQPDESVTRNSSFVGCLMFSLVLTVVYAVLNLALVILVCPPLGRFTDAAGVFLGMPVFCLVMLLCQRLRSALLKSRPDKCAGTRRGFPVRVLGAGGAGSGRCRPGPSLITLPECVPVEMGMANLFFSRVS